MRFLVDAQLPPALSSFLRERGYTAWHVVEVGCRNAEDGVIWNEAHRRQAVVLTRDEDFARRAALSNEGPGVVWVRVGNRSNDSLLSWFAGLLPEILIRLEAGDRLVEIR